MHVQAALFSLKNLDLRLTCILSHPQKKHRVSMVDFWRTFNHDGKISHGWGEWGEGGARPPPFTLFSIMYKVADVRVRVLCGLTCGVLHSNLGAIAGGGVGTTPTALQVLCL
jgi:hypothetical protein